MLLPDASFEEHFSLADLARIWRIGRETVRKLVMNEPGVVRIQLGRKKSMCRYSVPASVAKRIHTRLTSPACAQRIAA